MIQGIIILFSNPKAIVRLLKNLGKNINTEDRGDYVELLSIGVLPGLNGLGIGKELIKKILKKKQFEKCKRNSVNYWSK